MSATLPTIPEATAPTRTSVRSRTANRVAAAAAAAFALAFFLTVAIIDIPHQATDTELLDWWQQSGNQSAALASGMLAVGAALLFAVVLNRIRALAADAGSPSWLAFAHTMGTAFICTLLVDAAFRGVLGYLVIAIDEPLPGVDVLRYSTALNYTALGVPVMSVLALSILAISVVVLRTRFLGRWIGFVGVVCGAVILVAVVAMVGAYAIPAALLWALCVAIALLRQPAV
jgi:hypothetical protein